METYESVEAPKAPGGSSKKKGWMIGAIVVVLLIAVAAIVFVVNRSNNGPDISSRVAKVSIGPNGFSPSTLQIQKGQEVTFTNQDTVTHHLTADQSALPNFDTTQPLQAGDTYTYTFEKTGTFHYYDSSNPRTFTGTVTVK